MEGDAEGREEGSAEDEAEGEVEGAMPSAALADTAEAAKKGPACRPGGLGSLEEGGAGQPAVPLERELSCRLDSENGSTAADRRRRRGGGGEEKQSDKEG